MFRELILNTLGRYLKCDATYFKTFFVGIKQFRRRISFVLKIGVTKSALDTSLSGSSVSVHVIFLALIGISTENEETQKS